MNINMDNEEIQHPDENMLLQSRTFKNAVTHFTVTAAVLLLYQILKAAFGLGVIFLIPLILSECAFDNTIQHITTNDIRVWIIILCIHSLFMLMIYFNHLTFIADQNNKNILAFRLNQVVQGVQVEEPRSIVEDSKKISILARQIKFEVQKDSFCGKCISKFMVFLFQILFFYGLYLFFQYYYTLNACTSWEFYFMATILVLSIYQYIDFYIIVIFAVLCSPFLLIFGFYYICSLCAKEQERQEIMNRLNPEPFKPNQIEGDEECPICRCAYQLDEMIVILKCSKFHHFHKGCLDSWLNVNSTCPLCRSVV